MNAFEAQDTAPVVLPRIVITYCTQCKWLLRAAYFAQELLSTFGTSIGEVALNPATGGVFTVYLTYKADAPEASSVAKQVLLWDRKAEGGFPETKILKQRVRNHIEPEKKLGHSDTPSSKLKSETGGEGKKAPVGGEDSDGKQAREVDDLSSLANVGQDPLLQEAAAAQRCEDCN